MATTRTTLSASRSGRSIPINATARDSATLIHAVERPSDAAMSAIEEIWIYATNHTGGAVTLTLMWGASQEDVDDVILSVPASSGLTLVIPGLLLEAGTFVGAIASSTSSINVLGYAIRTER